MIFKICDKCKKTNVKTLIPKLKQLDVHAEIQVGCQNLCGIGRNKAFVIVDYIPIIADHEEELIEKIKEYLHNKK